MIVDFPVNNPSKETPFEELSLAYENLIEMYLQFSKTQLQNRSSYFRIFCIFLILSAGFFILDVKGIISNSLIGVIFTGIGAIGMLMISMKQNLLDDKIISNIMKNGLEIEKKFSTSIESKFFYHLNLFHSTKMLHVILERILPFTLTAVLTVLASIFLILS